MQTSQWADGPPRVLAQPLLSRYVTTATHHRAKRLEHFLSGRILLSSTHRTALEARAWRKTQLHPQSTHSGGVGLREASAAGQEWTKGAGDAGGRLTVSPFLIIHPTDVDTVILEAQPPGLN